MIASSRPRPAPPPGSPRRSRRESQGPGGGSDQPGIRPQHVRERREAKKEDRADLQAPCWATPPAFRPVGHAPRRQRDRDGYRGGSALSPEEARPGEQQGHRRMTTWPEKSMAGGTGSAPQHAGRSAPQSPRRRGGGHAHRGGSAGGVVRRASSWTASDQPGGVRHRRLLR